jgi:tetratricopeptide (TPR) repeat protein
MKGEQKLWSILNDKLDTLRASNRLPEAIRVAETALEVAKRAFPGAGSPLATSFEKLGELLDQKGDRASAKAYLLKTHAILEKVKPPDQIAIYRSALRLAFLCDNLGHSEEAFGFYEKQLGPNHADVASVLNNLAVFYTNERRYSEAEKIHLRALDIREKLYPATHPDIAQSKCNLAVVYHSRGDYAKAAELYRASLKSWEEASGKPSEDYEVVASNYADLLRSLGQARKAHQVEVRARKRRSG